MKKEKEYIKKLQEQRRERNQPTRMDLKESYLKKCSRFSRKKREKKLKKYYKKQRFYWKYRIRSAVQSLCDKNIKYKILDFCRWVLVDFIRGRPHRSFGIYQYIALPGEGKTMSMVAHMERFRMQMEKKNKDYIIATNFDYAYQTVSIDHWIDIVKISNYAYKNGIPVLIAMDEIHITFDSSEWKDFPAELLAVLSFVRKYGMQFLVSAQIYERIPKKIRDIANFTVVCKNVGHLDRYFKNYYYEKDDYEIQFEDTKGKKKKAKFTRSFVAGDNFYRLYNTKQQVDRMILSAKEEKERREQAKLVLFKNVEE